jgi:hypothetical protein
MPLTGRYLPLDASLACNKIAECTLLQRACGSDADDALRCSSEQQDARCAGSVGSELWSRDLKVALT